MVFLSWSKTLSNKLAVEFKDFASKVVGDESLFWISNDIKQGSTFFSDIEEAIKKSNMSIVFLTRDNIANPWINYELGAFNTSDRVTLPIFFDSIDIYSDIKMTPFEHLQVKPYNKESIFGVIDAVAKEHNLDIKGLEKRFEEYFPTYNQNVINILSNNEFYDVDSINDIKFMLSKNLRLINQDERVLYFEHGFETHDFYSFVLKTVKKRLYIFGRKNKKLFDRSNVEDLKRIAKKVNDGKFDLKILAFNPEADESVLNAAQKKRNFKGALENSINDALDVLDECGLDYHKVMRFYDFYRNELIVILDSCVFFVNISYDVDGKPFHLTDSPFYACDISSAMGKKIAANFDTAYSLAVDLDL